VRAARGALQRPLRPDGPVQELPPRRGVRLCLLQRVLHHTANAFGRFQDLCRVPRPGGFIVIGLYNTATPAGSTSTPFQDQWRPADLARLLHEKENAG
jgi:hypothetical protein